MAVFSSRLPVLCVLLGVLCLCLTSSGVQRTPGSDVFASLEYVHVDQPRCKGSDCNYDWAVYPEDARFDLENERLKLAHAVNMLASMGMDEGVDGHVTRRVPQEVVDSLDSVPDSAKNHTHVLMDRFGVGWGALKPRHIITVDTETFGVRESASPAADWRAAIWMNSAFHAARPDVQVILHLHPRWTRILSATKGRIEMIDQNSMRFYDNVAYIEYPGIAVDEEKTRILSEALIDHDYVVLRNHGVLICAGSIEEAFSNAFYIEAAVETQLRAFDAAAGMGVPVNYVDPEVARKTARKLQGQAQHMFAYFFFESYRRQLGLVVDSDGPAPLAPPTAGQSTASPVSALSSPNSAWSSVAANFHCADTYPLPDSKYRFLPTPLTEQRPGALPASLLRAAASALLHSVNDLSFNKVVSDEDRTAHLSSAVALLSDKPLGIARWSPVGVDGEQPVSITCEYAVPGSLFLNGVRPGDKVLLVDDMISTGGTMKAMVEAVEQAGGEVVGVAVLAAKEGYGGVEDLRANHGLDIRVVAYVDTTAAVARVVGSDVVSPTAFRSWLKEQSC